VFQTESLHLKLNRQNGSNCDLNPNRDWDLPITDITAHMSAHLWAQMQYTIWHRTVLIIFTIII